MRDVLIVDDSALARMIMRRSLAATGHLADATVREAKDGVEALAALEARPPDLMFADIFMPRLDGEGLLRAIRGNPALDGVFVLMCSSAMSDATAERLRGLGAHAVLRKPFTPIELRAALAAPRGGR